MDGSIRLSAHERNVFLREVRRGTNPERRLRAHILLLLDRGVAWNLIVAVLFTSSSTINRWRQRYLTGGLEAVLEGARPRRPRWQWVIALVIQWVTLKAPRDFGFYRSRWTCGTVVALLAEDYDVHTSRETVRRWLHGESLVWRRPRPVLGPKDPRRAQKLQKIRALLHHLPANEMAFFEDEVDINTNPKIGCMWMERGKQAEVPTPGDNAKRYLSGSMDWQTGKLVVTEGSRRDADLFLAHLDELRRRYRGYRRIHVICDNARFHHPERCKKVQEYLRKWAHRIELHYLPLYAPETNPIERVWWHLHEQITRNHRCFDIARLVQMAMNWLEDSAPFRIEGHVYDMIRNT